MRGIECKRERVWKVLLPLSSSSFFFFLFPCIVISEGELERTLYLQNIKNCFGKHIFLFFSTTLTTWYFCYFTVVLFYLRIERVVIFSKTFLFFLFIFSFVVISYSFYFFISNLFYFFILLGWNRGYALWIHLWPIERFCTIRWSLTRDFTVSTSI